MQNPSTAIRAFTFVGNCPAHRNFRFVAGVIPRKFLNPRYTPALVAS
jgi:hypothetical protein